MTHLLTRTQLARVNSFFPHRSKPFFATTFSCSQFSTQTTATALRRTHPLLRQAMDAQRPESAASTAASEDFVHVADLKMESDHGPATLQPELSRNVLVLSCESAAEGGVCDVYLVGTVHVSKKSSREVQAIVNYLKPQVVFLELCSSRVKVLTLQNLKVPTMAEMITMLKKKHNMFGVLYGWFLAKIASELDVLPCCEFYVAYEEATKYGGRVILGDRPAQITLRRTWSKMPLWEKKKLLYSLFFPPDFFPSSDDLNKMLKGMDDSYMLPRLIQDMSKEFPTLMETLVHERDQYMSSTLLKVASENSSVVAVVGKGHLQGIKKHWKQPVVMRDLMTVPSPKPGASAIKIFTSVGVAVAGVAIISGIYLSCKK